MRSPAEILQDYADTLSTASGAMRLAAETLQAAGFEEEALRVMQAANAAIDASIILLRRALYLLAAARGNITPA
jgi:hypothetical protein